MIPASHPPITMSSNAETARHAGLWALAAIVAFSAHAGAGWWVMRSPAPPLVLEAAPAALVVDIAQLGFASADQVSSGEEITPVDTAEAVTPEDVAEAMPEPTVQPVTPAPATEARPQPPIETPSVPIPTVEAPSEVQIAATPPVERSEPIEQAVTPPDEAETIEAAEEQVPIPEVAPLPTRRPEQPVRRVEERPEPRRETPRERPRQQAEPTRKAPPQRQAGNRGRNNSDTRQGQSEGRENGRANAASATGNSRSARAGNAAVSNYPGQVVSKLRRSLRYPREARSQRLRGEVQVAFTVSGGGGVGGVRIARSSGSPVLDRAALETVQRAAPFPPIPADAGRSSWTFTVPLAFTR